MGNWFIERTKCERRSSTFSIAGLYSILLVATVVNANTEGVVDCYPAEAREAPQASAEQVGCPGLPHGVMDGMTPNYSSGTSEEPCLAGGQGC